MIVGLDCSSKNIGWAILTPQRELVAVGSEARGKHDMEEYINGAVYTLMSECDGLLSEPDTPIWLANIAIEVNSFPKAIKTATGARSYRICRWAEGRLFQALGIDNPMEFQASAEKKPVRRERMETKYADGLVALDLWWTQGTPKQQRHAARYKRKSHLNEHEIDALAVADAAAVQLMMEVKT